MIAAILPAIFGLIDKFIPNKDEADKRKAELNMMVAKGEIDLAVKEMELLLGQIAINKEEAKHASLFVAGWRPAVGWLCVLGLGWQYFLLPILLFVLPLFNVPVEIPQIQTGELLSLVMALLGVAGLRTYEKFKGVAREELK